MFHEEDYVRCTIRNLSLGKPQKKMFEKKLFHFCNVRKSSELNSCGANKNIIYLCPQMAIEFEDAAMICPQIRFQKSGHPKLGLHIWQYV